MTVSRRCETAAVRCLNECHGKLLVLTPALVALLGLASVPVGAVSPINPENRPTPLRTR
jgi:hypothetical protein